MLSLQLVSIKTITKDCLPLQFQVCSDIKIHVIYKTEKKLKIIVSQGLSFCKPNLRATGSVTQLVHGRIQH